MLKVQEIREIIKLIDQSSINEFTYELDGAKVSMKKTNGEEAIASSKQIVEKHEQPKQVPEVTERVAKEEKIVEPASVADSSNQGATVDFDHEVVSPMVGTLYIAENPESDPFVQIGGKVQNDTVVCIVEAMKLFNEIEAEVTGEVVEVLVEDGELVEYGQPLFRVKTK